MPDNRGKMNEEMFKLARRMNQLMDDWMHASFRGNSAEAWQPAVDVIECERGVCIIAELAGMQRANVRVEVECEKIVLSGQRQLPEIDQQRQVHQMELARGPFRRTVTLPFKPDADRLQITCQAGLLEIRACKADAKEK